MDSQITFIEYCIHCYNKVNPESLHLPKINTMASKMSLADAIEKVADSEDSCSDWEMSENDLVEARASVLLQDVFREETQILLRKSSNNIILPILPNATPLYNVYDMLLHVTCRV